MYLDLKKKKNYNLFYLVKKQEFSIYKFPPLKILNLNLWILFILG